MSPILSGVSLPRFSCAISSLLFLAINASLSLVCGEEKPDSLTGSEVRLAEIREKVAQAEALYRNFGVKYAVMTQGMFPVRALTPKDSKEKPVAESSIDWDSLVEIHAIRQGDLFRVERDSFFPKLKMENNRSNRLIVYDGHETKDRDRFGRDDRTEFRERCFVRDGLDEREYTGAPHLMILDMQLVHRLPFLPLSVLLSGHDAIMTQFPRPVDELEADIKFKYVYKVVDKGSELLDGLECEKVSIRRLPTMKTKPWASVVIWLARSRNYLPVQIQFLSEESDGQIIGRTREFREIAPGVWYPFNCEVLAFSLDEKRKPGALKLSGRTELQVHEVSLAPAYDRSKFELALPEDAKRLSRFPGYAETAERLKREEIETVARLKQELSRPITNPEEIRHRAIGDRVAGIDRRSEIFDSLWSRVPKKYLPQILLGSMITIWILLLIWRHAIKKKVVENQKQPGFQSTGFPPK